MLPTKILLPTLSASERADILELIKDYDAGKKQADSFTVEAKRNRKRDLEKQLLSAKGEDLLTLAQAREVSDTAFESARRASRGQLKLLNPRLNVVFSPILDRAEAQAKALLTKVRKSYAAHLSEFGLPAEGISPAEAHLNAWLDKTVDYARRGLALRLQANASPVDPRSILPYELDVKPVKTGKPEMADAML